MRVKTSRFGEIEVSEADRVSMVGGILGFHGLREYVLYRPADLGIFRWLQSAEIEQLAFVVCDPRVIVASYHMNVSREELVCIELSDASQAEILVILTYPQNPGLMTANLQGPIVLNTQTRLARQLVLMGDEYGTRHKVFPGLDAESETDRHLTRSERKQECA